jgi:hypothetical protein
MAQWQHLPLPMGTKAARAECRAKIYFIDVRRSKLRPLWPEFIQDIRPIETAVACFASSLSLARTTIYSDPVVSRNKGNLELPFMSDEATTLPCQLPAGDGNSFLANRCHKMTAHVSGKLLLV